MSRRLRLGAVLFVLALVGVSVIVIGQADLRHDGTATMHVERVDGDVESSGDVLVYQNLSSGQQEQFEQALHHEDGTIGLSDEQADEWVEIAAVKYQNQTYAVAVSVP